MSRPVLSLAAIDEFDPHGPPKRKWCPLCGGDKPKDAAHRSLSVERARGLWRCFRCGQSGQAREFWPDKGASAQNGALRRTFELSAPTSSAPDTPNPVSNLAAPLSWHTRWEATTPLEATAGAHYLAARGLSPEAAQFAGVRWSANWSGHGAVVFPICGRDGQIVAAQARAVRGNAKLTAGPKKNGAFWAPVALREGRMCGPLDAAAPAILIVEAPIDALSLATCGFPSLALCGTSGPAWLPQACGLRRVVLALDADEAGDAASEKLHTELQTLGARAERLRPEGAKDWNALLLARGPAHLDALLVARLLV